MGELKPESGFPLTRLASGIEAGVIGGLAMIAVIVCASLLEGHPWWAVPNLLGSTFYGRAALRTGPGAATLSGMAFQLAAAGTVGGLFGLICGGVRQRSRLILLGLLVGIGIYNLANLFFWTRVNPLVPAYSPYPSTMFSYLLFGACLGWLERPWMERRPETMRESPPPDQTPLEESAPPLVDRIE